MSTYSQLYVQLVFAVRGRQSLIHPSWDEELYKYVAGILKRKEQKPLAINGVADHIHILIGMRPTCCLSDLVREVKKSSNTFINDHHLSRFEFSWQEGFGAFSYHHDQLDRVIGYIQNQKAHHRVVTFRKEYNELLNEFKVTVDPRYHDAWLLQCGEADLTNVSVPR